MLNLFIFLFGLYCVFQKKRALKNANKYAAIKKKSILVFLITYLISTLFTNHYRNELHEIVFMTWLQKSAYYMQVLQDHFYNLSVEWLITVSNYK